MKQLRNHAPLATAALITAVMAVAQVACISERGEPVTVDRTFTVSGPVHLELTNTSGDSKVIAGAPGEVRIHAEFRVKSWSEHSARKHADEMKTSPPFSQEGNMIRIGGAGMHSGAAEFNYMITIPPETEIHSTSASGNIEVEGVKGPLTVTTGSGNISASNISGDIQAHTGSGTVQLASIDGQVQASAGSGDIALASVRGDIRLQAGSGVIRIASPSGAVVATAGSGSVSVAGAMEDLRVRTSSGNVTVTGDPQSGTYWDFRTTSGNVALQVSPKASFRFYAKTGSGDIDAAIPVVMEGTAGKHALRARIGDSKGRVEVETNSGNVALH